jgi:hypothetical protein
MTQEPHDRGGRIALASLINQGLVGDPDSHGYAIHPDVAYSLDIATRVLRSSVRTMSPRAPKRTAKLAGAKRAQPKPTPRISVRDRRSTAGRGGRRGSAARSLSGLGSAPIATHDGQRPARCQTSPPLCPDCRLRARPRRRLVGPDGAWSVPPVGVAGVAVTPS